MVRTDPFPNFSQIANMNNETQNKILVYLFLALCICLFVCRSCFALYLQGLYIAFRLMTVEVVFTYNRIFCADEYLLDIFDLFNHLKTLLCSFQLRH